MEKKIRGINRRDFLKYSTMIGAGAAAGSNLFFQHLATAADKEVFTIAMSGGSWGDGNRKVFVEESGFAEKHNLDMRYSIQIEGVAVAKGIANCGNPIFDTNLCFNANSAKLYEAGCAVDLNPDWIPNSKDVLPQAHYGTYAFGYSLSIAGLVYNKEKVKPAPQSYEDLWNPKYKGRVGIPSYSWVGMYWLHAINRFFGGDEDNVEPGIKALSDLMRKQKPLVPDTVDLVKKLFHQGELWLMPFWDGRERQLVEEGAPVDIMYPKDMLVMAMTAPCMKGTKNPKLVHDFINVTLDPELQVSLTKIFKYSPTNKKCKLPPDLDHIRLPEKEMEKAAQIDWVKVVRNTEKNMELWNKRVLGA
jgi:putative spermidine/putrescine transport system substrate-binding protein